MRYIRVSKKNPCPICNHADWCGISEDGAICICMRTESPRQSKNGGWVHQLTDKPLPPIEAKPKPNNTIKFPRFNVRKTMIEYRAALTLPILQQYADNLGFSADTLREYGCGYSQVNRALAIPMYSPQGVTIGIRLRNLNGEKWAVKGSLQGLFLQNTQPSGELFIAEGPTDAMALYELGYPAIGRPSCSGMFDETNIYIKRNKINLCYIIADNDAIKSNGTRPGLVGAKKLADSLHCLCRIVLLPAKDVRSWYNQGATPAMLKAVMTQSMLIG